MDRKNGKYPLIRTTIEVKQIWYLLHHGKALNPVQFNKKKAAELIWPLLMHTDLGRTKLGRVYSAVSSLSD